MTLEDRKTMIITRASTVLNETELAAFTTEINAAADEEALKVIIQAYKDPNRLLELTKQNIDKFMKFLKDRDITWEELAKRKDAMLNATTWQEFVAAYKW